MKCQNEVDCDGSLDGARRVPMRVSCEEFIDGLVCPKCGRLHHTGGQSTRNRAGYRAFVEGDELVMRDANGGEMLRAPVGT